MYRNIIFSISLLFNYNLHSLLIKILLLECNNRCYECNANINDCIKCNQYRINSPPNCSLCIDGYFENENLNCEKCHYSCQVKIFI